MYGYEISWTIVQDETIVCSLSGLTDGENYDIETKCCVDKTQKIRLTCSDLGDDAWNLRYPDAGITIDNKRYCNGDFGSEYSIGIIFEGKSFSATYFSVNNKRLLNYISISYLCDFKI